MNGFAGGLVGGAVVRLFLDSSQFNTAFKQAEINAKTGTASMEKRFGKIGVAASAGFMIAQAAMVAFVASGVRAAIEYERAFQRIAAISSAPAEKLGEWKNAVLEISRDTAVPANELAEALYFLSSAGLSASEVMPVLEASAQAAAVGLGTTADVARITSQALNAYAGTGLTAAQVVDTLTAAVREGSAEPEAFAEALGNVLSTAARAGVGFDEITGSLAALSNVGVDVNEGVTAMNSLLMATTASSPRATKALADLGISTDQLRAVIRDDGVLAALQMLEEATGGNIDAMRKIIPNVRALKAAFGLTGQEAAKVSAIFDATLESTGSLAKAFEATMNGPAKKLEVSLNELALGGLEIGLKLVPVLVTLSKVLGFVGDNMETLLVALLAYKAVNFLPTLMQTISTGLMGMGTVARGAAVNMQAVTLATETFATAMKTAMPLLALAAGVYMGLKMITGNFDGDSWKQDNLDKAVAEAQAAGKDSAAKIEAARKAYIATIVNPFEVAQRVRMGLDPLTDEQKRMVEEHMKPIIAAEKEAAKAVDIATMSMTEFTKASGGSLRALEPLARMLGKSYSDMATEVKAALSDETDAAKAWADLQAGYLADAKQAIQDWRAETTASLSFVDDRFAELAGDGEKSISKIITQLKKSLEAQVKFNQNLIVIADRAKKYGVDASAILQMFIDQGPAAADTVAAFAASGKDAFLEIIGLMDQSEADAGKTAKSLQDDVVGTLKQIRDILEAIARAWNIPITVDVDDTALDQLIFKMQREGIPTSGTTIVPVWQTGGGLATGGVIAAANGIVSRPTFLVGEGAYPTAFGTGAELVQPLNARTLERLGSAIGAYTVRVQGEGGGGNTTNVVVNAAISPLDVAQNIEWWRRTSGR